LKRLKAFSVFVLIFSVVLLMQPFSQAGSDGGLVIKCDGKAVVGDDKIYLGKIGLVSGRDASAVRKVERIVLGKSPLPGDVRRITADYIRLRLKQADVDLNRITLKVPKSIEVHRASVTIPTKELRQAVTDFIYANMPWDRDRVKIREISIGSDVLLPKGNVSYRIEPLRNADYKGRVPLPIHFMVNGLFQKRVLAMADISVLTEVVVARKTLRRYARIEADDIELREKDLSKTRSRVITDPDELVGMRAKRTIAAGTILRPGLIDYPPLVRRGDVVLVVARTAGLRITALGVVDQREGRKGEKIKVENLDSKKNIYARVLDSKTVEVEF